MDINGLAGTQTLALWGALTGTIGTATGALSLWLRYRHHKRDQTRLRCEASFSYEISDGVPKPRYKFVVRNVGRRPVTLDTVRYYYKPTPLKDRLLRAWLWRAGQWRSDDEISNHRPEALPEGQKTKIQIKDYRLQQLSRVGRVSIIDQTGRAWRVPWPNSKTLERETSYGEIDRIEEENARRVCKLVGYELKGAFFIYALWNPEPPNKGTRKGRTFPFEKREQFDAKWKELRSNVIPALMTEERDEIA